MIETELYSEQTALWPRAGRHILAQFDERSVVVYQAYNAAIAGYAVRHGRFGEGFSFSRMSWIKPNFLWMMYRSGWGTKENQEATLGLRVRRDFFEEILRKAVASSWDPRMHATEAEWKGAVAGSEVRLQWDPDHGPEGNPLERRAIQLGLRGEMLRRFSEELLEVIDLSAFVAQQRWVMAADGVAGLVTPRERVFVPGDEGVRRRLGLDGM